MLFGPESSGKTTLAKKLSEYYQGTWVPEFAREYLQQKWDAEQKICEPQDILPIAIGQMKLENAAVKSEKKVVFCDADLFSNDPKKSNFGEKKVQLHFRFILNKNFFGVKAKTL